jgi:uncharacterized phage protein (TIGR01671 family)
MREIKFRIWDNDVKKMTPFDALCITTRDMVCMSHGYQESHIHLNQIFECLGNEAVIMQYIGEKDKNGNEVYEGDILIHINDIDNPEYGIVRYYERQYKAVIDGDGSINDFEEEDLLDYRSEMYIVVGNIYQNPELLIKSDVE